MPKKNTKKPSVRLGNLILPTHYTITLKPDLEAHVFDGEETITLNLAKPTKEITLHSKDLKILSAVISVGKENIPAEDISYDVKKETATFTYPRMLSKGSVKLHIVFEGILADNMRGFYKSKYVVDGKDRWMATTQFEATDARRCIPCFDEPTHKAVFDVHLVIPNGKTAISNTLPHTIKEHEAGYKIVSFESTPKMSTYLLAFIVGDFEWVEKKTKSGVLVRVMTVPGKSHQGNFALDVTVRCLEFYEQYFDIKYPLTTLDMIAIPDFAAGAMENWGAITCRESCSLVDENNTSTSTKEFVVEIIAHELAHQWFGNLVTMEWWTHLWLNEGFASYIPYLAMDALFPEFDIWPQFVGSPTRHGLTNALHLDGLKNTHPIEVEVHHPNEIGEIFDLISYDKGSSVIGMLHNYLGEKDFRDGLRLYLKKHSYKNASTVHLWDAFEKVSGKPVKKMMAIWTGKPGYPVITAVMKNGKLSLSQKRFFSSSTSAKKTRDTTVWPIPLSAVTSNGIQQLPLMTKKKMELPLSGGTLLKLNAHQKSMYRVAYDPATLQALTKPLGENKLSAEDRLGIIRDLFALSEAGEISTIEALSMLEVYKNETEYIVWLEIVSGLRYIANLLSNSKAYDMFCVFARDILSDIVNLVGFDVRKGESHSQSLMRPLVLGAAAYFGNDYVLTEAQKRFKNRKTQPIHADIRSVVYGVVARMGGEKEYGELLSMYRKETLHEEKNRLVGALGMFKEKKLLEKTLVFAMTDEVRMQDRNGAFATVLVNRNGRDIGWKFLKKNWKKLSNSYGEGNHMLSRLIAVLNRHTTKEAYTDIKTFFKTHSAPAAKRTIEQTLEHIDSNIQWLKRDEKKIEKWLKEKQS